MRQLYFKLRFHIPFLRMRIPIDCGAFLRACLVYKPASQGKLFKIAPQCENACINMMWQLDFTYEFMKKHLLFSSWDETINDFYYFNVETGETQWCHPLDDIYRQKVVLARQGE